MKKIITALIIVLMVSGTAWGDWITNPDTGKRDYYKDYDTAIANLVVGGLADIDDLPGDEVDDNKIDSSLINNAAADGSTKGVCTFSASHFSAASGVISLNTTLDLSAFTITFGLEASDIPNLSATYQTADAVLAALAALANGSGVLTNDGSGNLSWAAGGGSMVYPGAGVPVSTGSAWGTSLTVGTGASNLVQLDESGKLPAVDGSSLTGLFDPASPGEIGGTTPAAATFTTLSAGAAGFSVDADGDVTAKSLSITRVTGQASYSEYYEVPANGDNKVTVKPADDLAADYTVTLPSTTGTLQLAGAEVDLPSSDADPDTTGEIRHDSTITGLLRGALKWFDGTGARILVDLDTAPSDDDYVVSYDADADKFYMKADATGAGGDQLVDIVTTAPLLVNGGANVNDALPGSDADITFSIADDGIDSQHYAAGSIDAEHLAAGAKFYSIAVADLSDTSTPSVLTAAETTNKCISNYKETGADHVFTMPAAHAAGNIIFTIGDEFQVDIEPATDDLFYLNGTAMAANEHIQNTADTLGERIVGYCVNINGTLRWMFYSGDTAWVEETPP